MSVLTSPHECPRCYPLKKLSEDITMLHSIVAWVPLLFKEGTGEICSLSHTVFADIALSNLSCPPFTKGRDL
jgi:hypothetical protein